MEQTNQGDSAEIRYEPDEKPPHLVSATLGLQAALLVLAGIVLTPAIVIRAAGTGESYLIWAVFAALLVSGFTTILQANRLGRIGAGHVLIMGTSGAFIAVCVTALAEGGPGLLATLVIASSLFQFVLSARLSLLRRIITPVVAGTVIALIAVTVMPIMFDMLGEVPPGAPAASAPASAGMTLLVVAVLTLCAKGSLRLWAPIIGLGFGCLVAALLGIYDFSRVAEAPWFGLPDTAWVGFDLSYKPAFWALLPAFIFVTLIGAIETVGDSIAIQRVSWRKPRAIDFRRVQGAVAADGVGNLLSGLAATVPNTTYSSSVPLSQLTGVAARNVGVCIGIILAALAFMPKLTAILLAIPGPVVAAYITLLMGLLFMQGLQIIIQDQFDYRKAVIAGLSFWIGTGFQNQLIFADLLGETLGELLGNGMTTGGLTAIALTLILEATAPRRRRIGLSLDTEALPKIDAFLRDLAERLRWSDSATERLCAAGEEALLSLIGEPAEDEQERAKRQLVVTAQGRGASLTLEFMAGAEADNLEDRIAVLKERGGQAPDESDLSLNLLKHFATSVRHQQYHDTDIVTIQVDDARRSAPDRQQAA